MSIEYASSQALLQPTGVAYAATEVTDPIKAGPWLCMGVGCRLILTHVKGNDAATASKTVQKRPPHFRRKHRGSLHSEACTEKPLDASKMSASRALSKVAKPNNSVLITFGGRPDRADLGNSPTERALPTTKSTSDYVGQPGSMASLLRLIETIGGHEEMSRYWHIYAGKPYRWRDIAYEASLEEYQRLYRDVSGRFEVFPFWPTIIWGTIQRGPKNSSQRENHKFITVASTVNATVPKVRLFMEDSPAFEPLLSKAAKGDRVAFLMYEVAKSDVAEGVHGNLHHPSDLAFFKRQP